MRKPLVAAVAVALCGAPGLVAVAPAAQAAEDCTPSVSVLKPELETNGWVTFGAHFTVCETTRIKVKYKERGTPGWHNSTATYPGGNTNTVYAGQCLPDGQPHRWVAYATLKLAGSTTQAPYAQTAKVYFKAPAVTRCGIWDPYARR